MVLEKLIYFFTLLHVMKAEPVPLKKIVRAVEKNEAYQKAIRWFFDYPEREITLSNLCANIGVSKSAGNKAVATLEKEGFLTRKVFGRVWALSANSTHPYLRVNKLPIHLDNLLRLGVVDAVLSRFPQSRAIILCGSYRTGDDVSTSDIDIAVEVTGNHDPTTIDLGMVNQLGYRRNVKVNLLVFSRNRIDLNLFNNIANGIVLHGFLEVRP